MPIAAEASIRATCANALVATLIAHGTDRIYCVPGIQNDGFFNALHDAGGAIRAIHTRHEQGAAYMALGAALATGRPAVYSVVPGPGVLNTTAALATAYATNAPVLCLSGQIPSRFIGRNFGLLHEIPDQLGILERLTKRATRATDPATAAHELAAAFRALRRGRPRPVALEIPPDILEAAGDFPPCAPLDPEPDPSPDAGALAEAATLLAGSHRPLIMVGGGAQDSCEWVRTLAERLQAPVVAYRMGRGVLDDRHPLSLTLPGGHRFWRDCDVVLAVGTRLQMPLTAWGVDGSLKIVRVEIDETALSVIRPPDIALVGPAESVLAKLAAEIDRIAPKRPSRVEETLAVKAEIARDLSALDPQIPFLLAIREAIGETGVLVEDLTQVGYVARLAFPVYRPRTLISPGYQGTLGWGYAAGLGVKEARPDVPVVSILGDGGFMFNVQEIATAIRHDIPLVAIVFNDGAYGNVRRMQQEIHGGRVIASDLANPDFIALGRSFGAAAMRAHTPDELRRAVETAISLRQPALIETPCGDMPSPWRFVNLPRLRGAA